MVGCQQAATDHGGLAVKSRDASVMKNPGSPGVASQRSEESSGQQEQGGLGAQEMGTPAMSLFSAFDSS